MNNMELIVGKEYRLKHTEEFCHIVSELNGMIGISHINPNLKWIFVGKTSINNRKRNIFYCSAPNLKYAMFNAENLDYVIDEKQNEVLEKIAVLEKELQQLKKLVK